MIRHFDRRDLPSVIDIWNEAALSGEVLYRPIDADYYHKKFELDPNYDPRFVFVAVEENEVIGFIHGISKKVMLKGESNTSSPGYLTCIFVRRDKRNRGIGTRLLSRLQDEFKSIGKTKFECGGGNPINIDWILPGTPGHDHNNAPGVDLECMGYPFLLSNGFVDIAREVAMYLDLSKYKPWEKLDDKRAELLEQGIYTGHYGAGLNYDYDIMCDNVGSDYWRASIGTEINCWKNNVSNTDNRFIPNGKIPKGPRTILAATHEEKIIAFTGPVDKQESGRGWFTGICTDPNYECRGIASVLFNLLMQEFIAEGAKFSSLFTGESNHAQKIYARAGFVPVRKWVVMRKDI